MSRFTKYDLDRMRLHNAGEPDFKCQRTKKMCEDAASEFLDYVGIYLTPDQVNVLWWMLRQPNNWHNIYTATLKYRIDRGGNNDSIMANAEPADSIISPVIEEGEDG